MGTVVYFFSQINTATDTGFLALFQCIDCDNEFTNTKYCILMMMHADMDKKEGLDTQDAKSIEEIW